MGQRLNFEVWNKGKVVGNCYYHWSGFTSISLDIMEKALNFIQSQPHVVKNLTDEEVRAYVEQLFIATGADNENRDNGLYGFEDKDIHETRYWAEATMYLYLDEERMDVADLFYMENEYDYMREEEIHWEDGEELNLPVYPLTLRNLKYGDLDEVRQDISDASPFKVSQYSHIVFTPIE